MDKAMRTAVGRDLIGMARMLEALSLGLLDHRTTFHKTMTKGENRYVEVAEKMTLKAAGYLRRVGNRMVSHEIE